MTTTETVTETEATETPVTVAAPADDVTTDAVILDAVTPDEEGGEETEETEVEEGASAADLQKQRVANCRQLVKYLQEQVVEAKAGLKAAIQDRDSAVVEDRTRHSLEVGSQVHYTTEEGDVYPATVVSVTPSRVKVRRDKTTKWRAGVGTHFTAGAEIAEGEGKLFSWRKARGCLADAAKGGSVLGEGWASVKDQNR